MSNKKYNLISALERMSEQVIYENLYLDKDVELQRTSTSAQTAESSAEIIKKLKKIIKFLPKAAGSFAKSTIMAIPVVDIVIGSLYIKGILARIKSLNDKMAFLLDLESESFAKYILVGNTTEYNDLMSKVSNLSEDDRQILREDFESALDNIKELILTIVQAYDTVAAAAPAAGAGALSLGSGAVAVEAGTNITTAALGFLASVIPIERFLLELVGKYEEVVAFVIGSFFKSDPGKLGEIEKKGGPLVFYVLKQYVTFDPEKKTGLRLKKFYDLLKREGEESYLVQGAKSTAQTMLPFEQTGFPEMESQIVAESYDLKRWQKLSGLS